MLGAPYHAARRSRKWRACQGKRLPTDYIAASERGVSQRARTTGAADDKVEHSVLAHEGGGLRVGLSKARGAAAAAGRRHSSAGSAGGCGCGGAALDKSSPRESTSPRSAAPGGQAAARSRCSRRPAQNLAELARRGNDSEPGLRALIFRRASITTTTGRQCGLVWVCWAARHASNWQVWAVAAALGRQRSEAHRGRRSFIKAATSLGVSWRRMVARRSCSAPSQKRPTYLRDLLRLEASSAREPSTPCSRAARLGPLARQRKDWSLVVGSRFSSRPWWVFLSLLNRPPRVRVRGEQVA
jgi:hypothetical protein